jgi:hypothetical protein
MTSPAKIDLEELNLILKKAKLCEAVIYILNEREFRPEEISMFREDRTRYIEQYNALRGVITPEPLKSKYDPILKGFRVEDLIVEN